MAAITEEALHGRWFYQKTISRSIVTARAAMFSATVR